MKLALIICIVVIFVLMALETVAERVRQPIEQCSTPDRQGLERCVQVSPPLSPDVWHTYVPPS